MCTVRLHIGDIVICISVVVGKRNLCILIKNIHTQLTDSQPVVIQQFLNVILRIFRAVDLCSKRFVFKIKPRVENGNRHIFSRILLRMYDITSDTGNTF